MPYVVMVDDNFHCMDEDERYKHGEFADAGLTIGHSRTSVDGYLDSAYKAGMSAPELWDSHLSFREDRFIPSADAPEVGFGTWGYAKERCRAPCAGRNPVHLPPADPSGGQAT